MDKTEALKKIRDAVWNLIDSPLYSYRKENNYYPVLGEGNHNAQVVFIGEAPGKNEAEQGRPFCGASGNLLDKLLASIELNRKDVYVTNIVKDRPPENRDPSPEEIKLYAPFLLEQLTIIKPKVIATLGRFSMTFILESFDAPEQHKTITALHGSLIHITTPWGPTIVLPLYHPAVGLYNGSTKETLFEDFKKVKEALDLEQKEKNIDKAVLDDFE
jgi:DNA polymerase